MGALGLDMGLGVGKGKKKKSGDPTAGKFSAFRFEAHDGRTLMPPRDCIIVSGAGSEEVNGRYYQNTVINGRPHYAMAGAEPFQTFYWSGADWVNVFFDEEAGQHKVAYRSSGGEANPGEVVTWLVVDGVLPLPETALIQEPQYKPFGLFSDTSFVTPAQIDQQVGGWQYPGKPIQVTESNMMLQPTLRSRHGVPVLEFSVDSLANRSNVTPSHTAITILAKNVGGNYSQAVVLGDEIDAVRLGITGQLIDARYKGNGFVVTADVDWPDVHSIVSLVLNEAIWELWLEGTLIATGAAPPIAGFSGNLYIGGDPDTLVAGTDPWQGDIIAAYGYNAADRLAYEARAEQLKGGVL